MKNIGFFLIFFIFPFICFGQSDSTDNTGQIQGFIFTSDKNPLADVYINITEINRSDVSDTSGYFFIGGLPAGLYDIELNHIGYKTVILDNIEISINSSVRQDTVFMYQQIFNTSSVVVTARRGDPSLNEIAGNVNITNADEIRIRQAKTSAEALREENGIFVQKTNHGGGSAIIRGLSSNQILLRVDGIRMNNSVYRRGNHQYLTTIDPLLANRIEVVRGPTSVLYGSDALGGTINVISSRPPLYSSEFKAAARFFGRYATVDAEKTGRMEFDLAYKKLGISGGFTYKSYSDLRRGAGGNTPEIETSTNGLIQSPSGYNAWDSDLQLRFGISPLQQLTVMFQHSRQDEVPRYDKYENENYTRWMYDPQIRSLLYARYEKTFRSGFVENCVVTTSWQRQTEGRWIQQNESTAVERELDDVQTLGLIVQAQAYLENHHFGLGAEIYTDDVKSQRRQAGEYFRGRYPDGARYTSLGIYMQDDMTITDAWSLALGARYSFFHTEFGLQENTLLDDIVLSFQALTASFGLVYSFSDNLQGTVNISQGFRAPNLSDLAKLGESKGAVYEVPNPDLDAEKMISTEMGISWMDRNFSARVSGYYSVIRDLLESADDTFNGSALLIIDSIQYKVKSKQNIGRAQIQGLEAQLEWTLIHSMSFSGAATYTFGQNITRNEPVGGIPPLFGRFGLKWKRDEHYAEVLLRFAGGQNRLSADDLDDPRIPEGGTPAWTILTVRGGYSLSERIILNLAVENIFDLNYREHGSGINGPGRNFILSIQADF